MKNATRIFLIISIFFLVISPVSAYFTKDHIFWSLNGFEQVNSPLTQQCSPYLDIVLDGNTASDVMVLHYFDDKVLSYVSTHTRGAGYLKCLEEAGSDIEKKCFCYGMGLHNIQDHFAHTEEGIVPEYISKYLSSNLFGHMVIEKNYQDKHQEFIANEPLVTSGQVDYYDTIILNSMFEETNGDNKFFDLLVETTSLDRASIENDARIFRSGYLGEGFFSTVYQNKISLPYWAWGIGIGLLVIGLGIGGLIFFTGTTKTKWITGIIWIFIGLIGGLIIFSFATGTTWKITNYVITAPAKLGYLSVSQSDIELYNNNIIDATNKFLETGNLPYDDNSGLSYEDRDGIWHEGALKNAEKKSWFTIYPILFGLFAWVNYKLIRKSYWKGKKKKKRRGTKI